MPPAFILSQDQTLHERKERPVDSGSTYSKLGSPRATRAGRSAHSIALSGFQGAGRLPQGEPQEVRHFRRGAYSKPTKGDCKPGWRNFPEKKLMKGISAPSGASLPPAQGRAHARQPRTSPSILLPTLYPTEAHCIVATHSSLHSPPYSLLNVM